MTLIDFTLSRLVTVTGEVAFCDLAADPELFKGPKGSVQVMRGEGGRRGAPRGTAGHRGDGAQAAGGCVRWGSGESMHSTLQRPGAWALLDQCTSALAGCQPR